MTDEKLQEILDLCRDSEIGVKRMRISIEDLSQF
jgi:hypothetical protein